MSDTGKAVPLARAPHDHMRQGFSSFAQDAAEGHPLERLSRNRIRDEFAFKMDTAERIYGSAFVMRMKTEVATLSQVRRLPGMPSSCVALETSLGRDQEVDFEDYLNLPEERPVAPRFKTHEAMEIKMGLL